MPTIGIADTTFARYNMGRAAIDEIQKNASVKNNRGLNYAGFRKSNY